MPRWDPPFWYGSREFSQADLDLVVGTVRRFGGLGFTEVAATICENLPWKAPNGQLKIEACMQLLLGLEAAGLVKPPARRPRQAGGAPTERMGTPPPNPEVRTTLNALRPVRVEPVPAEEGPAWNAMMATYHPLGFRRAFGAQQKYWVRTEAGGAPCILGGLMFAAAAKALAVRDEWIGWSAQERQRYRERIVANNRYLLLPGVTVPHLASHVLGLALRRLPGDWAQRYGFEPVLVETFVEQPWAGTCYRAANWLYLGQTAGRGRQDREHARAETVKAVWVYPLRRDWRQRLTEPLQVAAGSDVDA
jgi:hypothetical protein